MMPAEPNNHNNNDSDKNLEEAVAIVAKNLGVCDYETTYDVGSLKGDNYLGVLTTVHIEGKRMDNGEAMELDLIAKSALTNELVREQAMVGHAYGREALVYTEVFPAFERLQMELHVDGAAAFRGYPRCYYTSVEPVRELLVLENLKTVGFRLWDRRRPMNRHHVRLVLEEYGRFHATSFALRRHRPEAFDRLAGKMVNFMFQDEAKTEQMSAMFKAMFSGVRDSLDPAGDKEMAEYLDALAATFQTYYEETEREPKNHVVFVHGDCWTNNMLFRYGDETVNGKAIAPGAGTRLEGTQNAAESDLIDLRPTAMVFLDFQMMRAGNPITDIAYFYYCCTSRDVFDELATHQDCYYESLSAHLRLLGCDPEAVYPRKRFLDDWRMHARFGLACALMLIRVMLSEHDEVPDMDKTAAEGGFVWDAFVYKSKREDECMARIKAIVAHMMSNGF